MTAAAWIVALLAAYPHLAHRPCVVARASQIAADADSAAAIDAGLHGPDRGGAAVHAHRVWPV